VLLNNGVGEFDATPLHYDVGDDPTGIIAGDFNGDGNVDLAVVNAGSDNVSVLLGVGDGTFGAATDFNVGNSPQMLVAGLWDGDANLDLAVTNASDDTVTVLFGDGAGAFAGAVDYNVGASPYGIATGNLDGDANADLVVSNLDNSITVLFGQGAGVFGGAVDYAAGTDPMGIVVDDFNIDGHADVAVVNNGDDTVGIYLGTGDGLGTLGAMVTYEVGDEPVGIAAGDFDEAGDANELVITNNADDTYSQITSEANDGIFDEDTSGIGIGGYWDLITFALIRPDGTWVGYGDWAGDIIWTPDVNGQYVLAVSNLYWAVDLGLTGSELGYYGTYQIDVYGMAEGALGSVHAGGDIGDSVERTGPTFTIVTGNVGIISATGDIVDTTIDVQSGSLSQLTAANFTHGLDVMVRDDIGLISGTDFAHGDIYAGQDIEEIRFAGNFSDQMVTSEIFASRHIGQIHIGGNMVKVDVRANLDGIGDLGYIDLVDIGGDLGSGSHVTGITTFQAGLGGDVRFVRVAGTVYTNEGGWVGPRTPVNVDTSSDPGVLRIVDDNGGVLTMGLSSGATASYLTLPIEGGIGVAIVNLTVNGGINLNSNGAVQIGQLDFTPGAASDSLIMAGTDRFDVYYLNQTGTANKIINSTEGSIVSAELGTAKECRRLHAGRGVPRYQGIRLWK
jgi:hypothetical protein